MLRYIENLRAKPESERRKAVLWISVSITGAIALAWIVSLAMRMNAGDFSFKRAPDAAAGPSLSETFSTFFDEVGKSFGGPSATGSAQQ